MFNIMDTVFTDGHISGPHEKMIRFRKRSVDRLRSISEHNRHPQAASIRSGSLGPGLPSSHSVSFVRYACLLLQAYLAQIFSPAKCFFRLTLDF